MKENIIELALFGMPIKKHMQTGHLNLSDLQNCYNKLSGKFNMPIRRISCVTLKEYFAEFVIAYANSKGININGCSIEILKAKNLWLTTGARNTKTTWCDPYIWFFIAKKLFPIELHNEIDKCFISAGYNQIFEVSYLRKEHKFVHDIVAITNGIVNWEKQYKAGYYRIDLYAPSINLAVEYDEKYHKKQVPKDLEREKIIKQAIKNITIIRVKEGDEANGINKILKYIYNAK